MFFFTDRSIYRKLNRIDDTHAILHAFPEPALKVESVRRRAEQVQAEGEAQNPRGEEETVRQIIPFEKVLSRLLKV